MVSTFAEIGLDDDIQVLGVAYHHLTGTVIAHTNKLKCSLPKRRIFFRSQATSGYQPIGELPEAISVDSYLLDQCHPALYFVTNEWKKFDHGAAGTWNALCRFDLGSHRCEPIITEEDLKLPCGWQACWLMSLLAMSADCDSVYCHAGLLATDCSAKHFIVKLELVTKIVTPIVELEAAFA